LIDGNFRVCTPGGTFGCACAFVLQKHGFNLIKSYLPAAEPTLSRQRRSIARLVWEVTSLTSSDASRLTSSQLECATFTFGVRDRYSERHSRVTHYASKDSGLALRRVILACRAHTLRHKRAFYGEATFGIELQRLFDLPMGATKTDSRAVFGHVQLDVSAAPEPVRNPLYGRHRFYFAAPARPAWPQSK
jgi:hypothetical protein